MLKKEENKRRIQKIMELIIVLILLFFLLRCCGKKKSLISDLTGEQRILQKMKEDESYLFSLYDSPNICEEKWIENYRNVGKTFSSYKNDYKGKNEEIKSLLEDYQDYGEKIQEIAIYIDESNYEEGILQLKELMETAKKSEEKLEELYEKEFGYE